MVAKISPVGTMGGGYQEQLLCYTTRDWMQEVKNPAAYLGSLLNYIPLSGK
jgi:hypothetical protein